MGNTRPPYLFLRNLKIKQLLQPYMEQLLCLKLGKEYDKAVYCLYLFST